MPTFNTSYSEVKPIKRNLFESLTFMYLSVVVLFLGVSGERKRKACLLVANSDLIFAIAGR